MHWGTERFVELHDALQASVVDGRFDGHLETLVDAVSDDLRGLLDTPPRSESSRAALGKQCLTLDDGVEYRLSTEFVNSAAQVSDELGLDELAAAHLVFGAADDAARLGLSPADAAVALFYVRRQYILDIVLFICDEAATGALPLYARLLKNLVDPHPGAKILASMKSVERSLDETQEKVKRGQFLGLDANAAFVESTQMQITFLLNEHQVLGCIYAAAIRNNLVTTVDITSTLEHVATFTVYNNFMLDYLLPMGLFFSRFDTFLSLTIFTPPDADLADQGIALFAALSNPEKQHQWKQPWWRGAMTVIFCSFYAGFVANCPEKTTDSYMDILVTLRPAIDVGGIEFLMAVAQDTSTPGLAPVFNDLNSVVRNRIPALQNISKSLSSQLLRRLIPILDLISECFITDLADILKEMRLNEEDTYLALASSEKLPRVANQGQNLAAPGHDLERFFLFVANLYRNRPDAAWPYWSDKEGSLFGFLSWASQCEVAFMSATFAEMLASLSCGSQSADAANAFLADGTADKSAAGKVAFSLSWAAITEILVFYLNGLEPKSKSSTENGEVLEEPRGNEMVLTSVSSKVVRSPANPGAKLLNDESLVVLFAYFRLIREVAEYSSQARSYCWTEQENTTSKRSIVQLHFGLLLFQSPLYAPILAALASFADVDHIEKLWFYVDDWAFDRDVYTRDGAVILAQSHARFDQLLGALPDALSLVSLVARMLQVSPSNKVPTSKRLADYTRFSIGQVFVLTGMSTFPAEDKVVFQVACLRILKTLLNPLDGELAIMRKLGLVADISVDGSTLQQYLEVFPYNLVQGLCLDHHVYEVLFSIIDTGLEALDGLSSDAPVVKNVTDAVDIVVMLLTNGGQPSMNFEKPILYNLSVIPHLVLYISCQHFPLALSSLRLLDFLGSSVLFKANPSRQNRILSILESVTDSERIQLGLIKQLEREDFGNDSLDSQLFEIKVAILDFLDTDLRRNIGNKSPTVAHFLLGFIIDEDGTLKQDPRGPNCIGSGVSLFDTVTELLKLSLTVMTPDIIGERAARVAALTSGILANLVRSPLSSALTLDYLREKDFLLTVLQEETVATTSTLWESEIYDHGFKNPVCARVFVNFFQHRASILEMLSMEFHMVTKNKLLSLMSRYLGLLMNLQHGASRSVLSFLDFMKFGNDFSYPAISTHSDNSKIVQVISSPSSTKQDLEAVLALKRYSKDEKHHLLKVYDERRIISGVGEVELSCLQAWCQLVPVIVNETLTSSSLRVAFVLETIQTLVPKLVEYSRTDNTFCLPLASLLVLLLEKYQECHGPSVAAFDRLRALFKAAVLTLPASLSLPKLRTDLYVICYQILKISLAVDDDVLCKEMFDQILGSGDRILQTLCWDALNSETDLRLVSLIFLQVLSSVSRRAKSSFVEEGLVRYNLLQLLVNSVKGLDLDVSLASKPQSYDLSLIKVTLCLFLQIAQTRQGANYLYQCGLLEVIAASQLLSRESLENKPQTDFLLIVFQLLAALTVSMGAENTLILRQVVSLLEKHQQLVVRLLQADAASRGLANDPLMNQLINAMLLLLSLTGYMPPTVRKFSHGK